MGQYKVPQDVEAEDKIIGRLTLKQFIYAVIGVAYGLITFQLFKKVIFLFVIVGLPPTILMLALGLYQRDGQPFEAYLLSLVAYWFKPRTRIWLKEDLVEVFKIEQPKPKPEEAHRDPREVRGQLEKLAQIVDTRGWAAKQADVQEPTLQPVIDLSDRLTTAEITLPSTTVQPQIEATDDMFDEQNNPSVHNLDALLADSEKTIHNQLMERMRQQLPTPDAPQPGSVATPMTPAIPTPTPQALPPTPAPAGPSTDVSSVSEMTTNPIADILKRAMETPDLKLSQVSQIAAQAQTQAPGDMVEGQTIAVRPNPPQS